MFKTYENDIDGITNKIGFSKRSFAEWGSQVKNAFNEGTGLVNSFKNALITAFTVPLELKEIKLIESADFQSIFEIDSNTFFDNFNKSGSKSVEH